MCSDRRDSRVDILKIKTYGEIDLDKTPIVILGCGHFFTAETLNGHMGMTEVYSMQETGVEDSTLQDVSAVLPQLMPSQTVRHAAIQLHHQKHKRMSRNA